ncbi:restriction endonuclease subunit S [Pseudoalteromonas sp. NGC95]|nr:restriction endonuclease subunit S [Pseudoalteromonas sp. NGC95]
MKPPKGWELLNIGDISTFQNGFAFKSGWFTDSGKFQVIKLGNVKDDYLKLEKSPAFVSLDIANEYMKYKPDVGDILISMTGTKYKGDYGYVCRVNEDLSILINQRVGRIIAKSELIEGEFLHHYMRSEFFRVEFFKGETGGVNQGNVGTKHIQSCSIGIPPLPEQKRIVKKLDSLLAQVDTIQQRLNNLPDIIKRFRQSVLAAAVSGKLTEQWRDENSISESSEELLERWLKERKERFNAEQLKLVSEEKIKRPRKFKEPSLPDLEKRNLGLPHTWTLVSVSQFSDCLDYIRVPVKKDDRNSAKGLYPYFGANGIVDYVDDYLFDDELVLVTEDETFYGRTKPIAFRSSGKCWVNNHAHVLRPVTKIASEYLCYSLMHYDVQPWLSGSTGRAKLGQAALNELPIGLPPETEIIEVVRVIEQYFALADTLEKNLANAKQRVDSLTQSILAKAFRGELVPQDPNDEPADKLLARIKAARLEAENLEKAAKKAAKASKK